METHIPRYFIDFSPGKQYNSIIYSLFQWVPGSSVWLPGQARMVSMLVSAGGSAMKKRPVRDACIIGIGTLLFFLLGRFATLPSPVFSVNICLQYGLLAFLAVEFGPAIGCISGLLGHVLIDLSLGSGIWWSWLPGSGLFGLLCGFGAVVFRLNRCRYSAGNLLKFNLIQLLAHVISWGLVTPVLDMLLLGQRAGLVFLQGISAVAVNALTTAVIGSLLLIGYQATVSGRR